MSPAHCEVDSGFPSKREADVNIAGMVDQILRTRI